jgi:hypothetical protein
MNKLGVWEEMPNELYVIGDIHGDFFALKQSLELTGCVLFDEYFDNLKLNNYNDNLKLNNYNDNLKLNNYNDNLKLNNYADDKGYYYLDDGCKYYSVDKYNIKWNCKKSNCFIVFSGDLIDRCRPNSISNRECINTVSDENCDYLILKLLYDLDFEAQKYNSRVIVILGNHELLNLQNDFKYVSLKGRENNRTNDIKNYLKMNISNIYGIIRINKYIIVHGGINNIFFDEFNKNHKDDLFESIELFNYELQTFIIADTLYYNEQSPFWDRSLGGRTELNINQCKELFDNNLLKIKNFDRIKADMKIIVAHCPQFIVNQNINLVDCQEYKNKIYRLDVGMSRAFDFYDLDKIKNILDNNDIFNNIINMEYNDFFINDYEIENRVVSCLKLTNTSEEIIKGKLSVDYFYNLKLFNNNKKNILLHILSDITKIFIDNYNKNYEIPNMYESYINKLFDIILLLSK